MTQKKQTIFRAPRIKLAESISPNEDGTIDIQVLKTGNFFDPRYGKFAITRKMFSEMIDNFKKGTRGIDISLDYIHKSDDIAAGWFKTLEERNVEGDYSELWGKVELTDSGKRSLSSKEFKYVSADFDPQYKDNEKGENHGCVLEGSALTNRPVIKGMQAIQLSETEIEIEAGEEYDKEKMSQLLSAMKTNNMTLDELIKLCNTKESNMAMTEQEKKEMELKDAEIAKLKEEAKANSEKLQLSEKNSKFDKMLAENKVVEAQRKPFLEGDMEKFSELAVKANFSESGHGNGHNEDNGTQDVEDQMSVEINKMMEEKKITLSEATKLVARNPKFAKALDKKFGSKE